MIFGSGQSELSVRWSVSMTRSTKATKRMSTRFENIIASWDRSSRLALTWDDASLLTACPQVKRAAPTVLWGGLAGIGGSGPGLLLPARVGFEGGSAEGLEPGEQL